MAARPVEDEVERGDALAAVVRGMAVAMVGSIFGSSLGFVLLVLMGRRLAPDELGLFVLALNLVNLVPQITIAGVDYAAIRYVSEARTPGAKRGAMLTPFAVAMAFNLAIGGSAFALARPLALHVFGQPHFVEGLRAAALTLPLTVAAQMISAAISGLERASGELVRKVVEQGGRIAFAFAAVLAGAGVGGIVLGLAAAAAVATLACAVTLAVVLPRGGRTQPVAVRAVVGFAWPQTVATAVGRSWSLLMLAFVSNLVGAHGVAIFGIAAALSRLPGLVYNSFTYRFTPTISRLWHEQDRATLDDMLRSVTRWVAIGAVPLYAIIIALPGPLLHIFGHGYADPRDDLVVSILGAGLLVDSLAGPVDRALVMTGHVKLEMLAGIVTALATVGFAYVLTLEYGVLGAAISYFVYNLLLNALKTALLWWKVQMKALSAALLGPLVAGASAGAAAAGVGAVTDLDSSLLGLVVLGAMLVLAYVVVQLAVVGISPLDRAALRLALHPQA